MSILNARVINSQSLSYTWQQLARRAGIAIDSPNSTGFESLDIPVFYGLPEQFNANKPGIVVVPASSKTWQSLLKRPRQTLNWLAKDIVMPGGQNLPIGLTIPVLFWGQGYESGSKPFAEQRADGSIVFYADIIAAAFFMLSRWEETVISIRDRHGRFPATASVAYKQEFLDRPIVDEYALILRAWLQVLRPQWKPKQRKFSVKLSHDVDFIQRFPNFYRGLRALGGDLLKRRSITQFAQTINDLRAMAFAPEQDNYIRGIYLLAELSAKYGFDSAFYFMADGPGPFGCGYDPSSLLVKKCIDDLREMGFEIGFHPGYDTFLDPQRLATEKSRLDAVLGETQSGGRQHFLRFRVPNTWRHWEQAGLTYDSTVGYADYEGFRCGTCHPFHPFDIEQNRELNLWEYPLIVMDGTLKQYRKFTPQEGKARILELAQRCRQVEGTFTLLWHNSSLTGEWEAWAEMYSQMLGRLLF